MTTYEPRCPALHPGLPYSRCAREKGHGMLHCNASGNTWDYSSDLMDGGVTCAAIEDESIHPERARSLVQERDEAERERARWQESAEAADRERHDWQARAVKAEDRAGEYHDTITALRTDLATALDRAEKAEENVRDDLEHRLNLAIMASEHNSERADKAERALADVHERDETVARLETRLTVAEEERGWWEAEFWKERKEHAALSRAESHDRIRDAVIETTRPVRAEDITISMCLRAANHFERHRSWEGALLAALTEPQRPEGAEDWEDWLTGLDYLHDETGASRVDLATLANDFASERGVRVTTEEEN